MEKRVEQQIHERIRRRRKKEESTYNRCDRERKKKIDRSDRGGSRSLADLIERGRKRAVFQRWSHVVVSNGG